MDVIARRRWPNDVDWSSFTSRKWIQRSKSSSESKIPDVLFIHIGKTGGTTVVGALRSAGRPVLQWHGPKSYREVGLGPETRIFTWVRNPYRRFVSAFNMARACLDFDITGLSVDSPEVQVAIAPKRIRKRIETGRAFSEEYEDAVLSFESASDLAEALTARDSERRDKSRWLISRSKTEHIGRGMGWFLWNGDFVRRYADRFILVGRQEHMAADLRRLGQVLDLEIDATTHLRRNDQMSYRRDLSDKAQHNLMSVFELTDFLALQALNQSGLLSDADLAGFRVDSL